MNKSIKIVKTNNFHQNDKNISQIGQDKNQHMKIAKEKIIRIQVNKLFQTHNKKQTCLLQQNKTYTQIKSSINIQKKHKSFEQLYFEKIKNKKNIDQESIQILYTQQSHKKTHIFPLSSKNVQMSVQLQTKNTVHSTKNSTSNKQNIHEECNTVPFFRKNDGKQNDEQNNKKKNHPKKNFMLKMPSKISSKIQYQNQQKIIKKSSNIQTNLFITQKLNNKSFIRQKSIFPKVNSLKTSFSQTISILIQSQIHHQKHQHIWGQRECFLTVEQFQLIMDKFFNSQLFKFKQAQDKHKIKQQIWNDLGGEKYSGIVKDNFVKFIEIILNTQEYSPENEENEENISDFQQQERQNNYISSNSNLEPIQYINESTLKLINLTSIQKKYLRRSYFSLFIRRQSADILQNVLQNLQLENNQNKYNTMEEEQPKQLINHAYLDSDNYRERQKIMTNSPTIISPYNKQNISPKLKQHMSDFSPKLSTQQHQPFKSTTLQRQVKLLNDNPTQVYSQHNLTLSTSSCIKPLLSVDVNLGEGLSDKLIVYEGQTPYEVSLQLKKKYNIEQELRARFEKMLQAHMRNLLFKIQEVSEQLYDEEDLPSPPYF